MNDNKKRIAFAIPSLGAGGAERVVSVLASELVRKGHAVSVIMTANDRVVYPIPDQVRLIKLNCEQRYGRASALARYVGRIKALRAAIAEDKPDVLISFMSETNIDVCLAVLGMKVPVIVSERNDPAVDPASSAKRLLRRLLYFRPDGFVFQTPDAQTYFSRKIQKRSCIILNPLTTQIAEPYTGVRDPRIVAVGRLNKQKNYPLLLEAFSDFCRQFPNLTLEIYGEGPQKREIENMVARNMLQDHVVLRGFCKDVHDKIREAAFFVMSSDFEGMPNALVEAMALGLPCISTDCRCGGPRLLIEHGENGLLVPAGDKEALYQAMVRFASDPEYAQALGNKAQQIRARVDTPIIVEQWLSYMEKILQHREKK